MKLISTFLFCILGAAAFARQDSPVDIPKNELPKAAACVVCAAKGSAHGEEKPAAGVRYKGKSYYFCGVKEVAEFMKDPESFMPPLLPRPAPAFSFKNLAGESVKLADLKGKVVVVDFWATWCKPCIETMPEMQKLYDKHADKGMTVLGVSIDEEGEKKVKPFLSKRKFTYPIVLDSDSTWKAFGVHAIPAVFLIDKDGQIVKQWTGKPDKKEVESAILALTK